MHYKILPILILLFSLQNIFSKEDVLIITTSEKSMAIYNEAIKENSDGINYDVKLIVVDDKPDEDNFNGSKYYLENEIISPPIFSIYIADNNTDNIVVSGFNKKSQPPLSIIKIILSYIDDTVGMEFPLHILNVIPKSKVIDIYKEYDIPLIFINGVINPDSIVEALKTDLNDENKETHYFIFNLLSRTYYFTEKPIFYTNAIFFAIIILLMTIYSKRSKFHMKYNRRYIMTIPFKILMIFVFYTVSGLVIQWVVNISGSGDLILKYPRAFFIIKHMILFFIYGISFHIVKDVSFSKSPYFYSHISLYLSIGIYLLLATIYLPLGFIQFWPIIITILFMSSKNLDTKRFLLFLNPLIILIVFNTFLKNNYTVFVKHISGSSHIGNIALTIIICPYVFLQESLYRFTHRRQNKVVQVGDIVLSLLTLTITVTLIAIILELK